MKKIFTKANVMPVAVLAAICLVIAGLLAVINGFTAPVIAEREEQKVYDSLREVLDGNFEPAELPEGTDSSVTAIYNVTKDGSPVGKVVTVSAKGYASTILLTVGVDVEGKVTKVVITSEAETHGKDISAYPDKFAGVAAEDLEGVETFSGATATSNAIKKAVITAVNASLGVSTEKEPEPLPKTDAEIEALAATLFGTEAGELKNVTPEAIEGAVKRVYKNAAGTEYAVYTVVISANYGTVETESLLRISRSGELKAIEKLTWKTSDAIYGYVPPTEEQVNAFYDRLVGATSSTVDGIEAATNATNTSGNLKSAISEAMEAVAALVAKDMPTEEAEVKSLAADMLGVEASALVEVTPADGAAIKKVYKNAAGTEYAVYTVVISANYGTVETESLLHISRSGELKAINKMTWKTSDAIYGYVPPTQEQVNAFYDRLVGATSSTLDGIEAATNATNTSGNLKAAISEAMAAVATLAAKDMPTEEAEVKKLAADMLGVSQDELTAVIPTGKQFVRRVYRVGNEFAVYAVVISANYGTVETESLVRIGEDGSIKEIKRMTWKTSDAIYGYVPPTEEQVNAFYDRLVGATAETLDGIEAATNATNTSGNLKAALTEAINTSLDLVEQEESVSLAPRIVGIVILSLAVILSAAATVFFKRRNRA